MVPAEMKSVLQGMNFTAKGQVGPMELRVKVTDWQLKMPTASEYLRPNDIST